MATWTYPAGEETVVRLSRCAGDVIIQPWDEPAVEIVADMDDDELHRASEQSGNEIHITRVSDDLRLRVPRSTQVEIEDVSGDAQIEGVSELRIAQVSGDVILRSIAGVALLEVVSGDLLAEEIDQLLVRRGVDGDARVSEARVVEIDSVGGELKLGETATVLVGNVGGDAQVAGAGEACNLGNIGGDLDLRDCGLTRCGHVGGDLTADMVRGIEVGKVSGDARVSAQENGVTIGSVGGDLRVRVERAPLTVARVGGGATVEGVPASMDLGSIGGDLDLRIGYRDGSSYRAIARGSALVRLADEADLELHAVVRGSISGLGQDRRIHSPRGPIRLIFGSGGPRLDLVVSGDLTIRGAGLASSSDTSGDWGSLVAEMDEFGREMADLGRQIASSIGGSFAGRSGEHGPQWRHRAGPEGHARSPRPPRPPRAPRAPRPPVPPIPPMPFDRAHYERIKEVARQAAHSGIERAQEAVERAMREMQGQQGQQEAPTAEEQPGGEAATGPTVDLGREAQGTPASDEERLAILRMVQEGRISPEEAEALLAALE